MIFVRSIRSSKSLLFQVFYCHLYKKFDLSIIYWHYDIIIIYQILKTIMENIDYNDLICPITGYIYNDPVIVPESGQTFEREAIKKWMINHNTNTCPITRKKITGAFIKAYIVKNAVDKLLKNNPDLKEEQYVVKNDISYNHEDNIDEIENITTSYNNYDMLLGYTNYNLNVLMSTTYGYDNLLKIISRNFNCEKIQNHIIDNCIDIEAVDSEGWRLIHYILKNSDSGTKKYIINKNNINLEAKTNNDWRPIHFVFKYGILIIKEIINKGVKLNEPTKEGLRPIHLLCENSNINKNEIIYFINHTNSKGIKIDYNASTNDSWRPIHYLCRYGSREKIMLLIDLVDLEVATNDGWKPVHFVCRYQKIDVIKLFISKNMRLDERIKKYYDEECNYSIKDLILKNDKVSIKEENELLKLISEKRIEKNKENRKEINVNTDVNINDNIKIEQLTLTDDNINNDINDDIKIEQLTSTDVNINDNVKKVTRNANRNKKFKVTLTINNSPYKCTIL